MKSVYFEQLKCTFIFKILSRERLPTRGTPCTCVTSQCRQSPGLSPGASSSCCRGTWGRRRTDRPTPWRRASWDAASAPSQNSLKQHVKQVKHQRWKKCSRVKDRREFWTGILVTLTNCRALVLHKNLRSSQLWTTVWSGEKSQCGRIKRPEFQN